MNNKTKHTPGPWTVGTLVETCFDTGAFGCTILYGRVVRAGSKTATIRWESGICNRVAQGQQGIIVARNQAVARAIITWGENEH